MFLKRPLLPADISKARVALSGMEHRGPDDFGEWIDRKNGVYIGHRRLSIIDLTSASAQPITSGDHVLAFNGEIYNFKDLQRILVSRGVHFTSGGDGEVLLRSIQEWGDKAFEYIDGMFAFAFWDGGEGKIAVDPFGEKPIFFTQMEAGVYISSEISPLAKYIAATATTDMNLWTEYLCLGFPQQPATLYSGIKMMPPGSKLTIKNGIHDQIKTYWSPPIAEIRRGPIKPVSEHEISNIVDALTESLSVRLKADVPLSLFLSSGVDSALIAALCRFELNRDVDCLTVSFADGTLSDEAPQSVAIAKFLGLRHQSLPCDLTPNLSRILELLGQPSGTVGVLPLEQISQVAKDLNFKVAITGLGGDEITSGYAKHAFIWRLRHFLRLPAQLRKQVSFISKFGPRFIYRFMELLACAESEIYLGVKNYPALPWLRQLPNYHEWLSSRFSSFGSPEVSIPRYELTSVMPAVHLYAADHASMRHSIELRTPFLNKEVVAAVSECDPRSLVAFGQKSVLRSALKRYLPEELINSKKMGFSYPRSKLLQNSDLPDYPYLKKQTLEECWSRRNERGGWSAIAVRLKSASSFIST